MSRYWLNSPDEQVKPEESERRSRKICQTYADAPALHERGTHTVSTDEKTEFRPWGGRHRRCR